MLWWLSDENGSGSVLAVSVLAVTIVMIGAVGVFALALGERHRVSNAADAAALAAADVASGIAPGRPCEVAATIASMNGAILTGCVFDERGVVVQVSHTVLGVGVEVAARAGAPHSRASTSQPARLFAAAQAERVIRQCMGVGVYGLPDGPESPTGSTQQRTPCAAREPQTV